MEIRIEEEGGKVNSKNSRFLVSVGPKLYLTLMSPQAVGSGVVTLGFFFLFLEVVLLEKLESEKKAFLPKKKLKIASNDK
jgi:hypothetical protein